MVCITILSRLIVSSESMYKALTTRLISISVDRPQRGAQVTESIKESLITSYIALAIRGR